MALKQFKHHNKLKAQDLTDLQQSKLELAAMLEEQEQELHSLKFGIVDITLELEKSNALNLQLSG